MSIGRKGERDGDKIFRENGELHFECYEQIPSGLRSCRVYQYSQEVPPDIITKGAKAIKDYAEAKAQEDFARKNPNGTRETDTKQT